jgi:cytochrome P450
VSAHTALPTVARPAHVPPELEVDFDFYNPPGDPRDIYEGWMTLQKGPPMVWTGRNGGHWIATRADELIQIQTDSQRFSYRSINIPPNPTPSLPLECDPPRHTGLRAIISPLFRPDTLRAAEETGRALAASLVEAFKDRGACEFQDDFARKVPIMIFLKLVDLPLDDREYLIGLAEKRMRSPIAEERNNAKLGLISYTQDAIAERKRAPQGDFISRIIHSTIDGQPLNEDDLLNLLATTLSGGLDTVASMMGFAMYRLAERPDLQERLGREPEIIGKAVDECVRRHGLSNITRIAARDMEFAGAPLREGDAIVTPSGLIGLDPDRFPDPTALDFDRPSGVANGSFGNGPHRCPGANLGRMEMRIMLQEWLPRIPRWRLDPDSPPLTGSGLVNTVHRLRLVWDV